MSSTSSYPVTTTKGFITSIIGCMFACKSTELIGIHKRYTFAKKSCVVIKHKEDDRYHDEIKISSTGSKPSVGYIISHDKIKIAADFAVKKLSELKGDDLKKIEECHAILIEEGHFYDDAADFAEHWADKGKHVYISGLLTGENREPIPTMARIVAKSENIIKKEALCSVCYNPASFTKLREGMTLGVGGFEKYTVRCRDCWDKPEVLCNKY